MMTRRRMKKTRTLNRMNTTQKITAMGKLMMMTLDTVQTENNIQ